MRNDYLRGMMKESYIEVKLVENKLKLFVHVWGRGEDALARLMDKFSARRIMKKTMLDYM